LLISSAKLCGEKRKKKSVFVVPYMLTESIVVNCVEVVEGIWGKLASHHS